MKREVNSELTGKDWYIFCGIYLFALAITVAYTVTHPAIFSDQLQEYNIFLQEVKTGHLIIDGLVSSSLTVTLIPAYIQRIFHINAFWIFKLFPLFLYCLMPAFVYLIARNVHDWKYSLISAGLIIANFYFVYDPTMGRVAVGWGMSAGLYWAILSRRLVWSMVLGVLLVFSHYGTFFIVLTVLGLTIPFLLFLKGWNSLRISSTAVLIVAAVIIIGLSWYFVGVKLVGNTAEGFAHNIVSGIGNMDVPKEQVVNVAVGQTFIMMPIVKKVEFFLAWFIIGSIGIGLFYAILQNKLCADRLVMATIGFFLVIITMIVPFISVYYGVGRVYFTVLPLLAPCFGIAVKRYGELIKVKGYWIGAVILVSYGVLTSCLF